MPAHPPCSQNAYLGYDPGGGGKHGVAALQVQGNAALSATVGVVADAEQAFQWLTGQSAQPAAVGIDTLTILCTGRCGDRPADVYLRATYPNVSRRVVWPNSLRGAMIANGIAVAICLRSAHPGIMVTETHPTVLDHELSGHAVRSWTTSQVVMTTDLRTWLGGPAIVGNLAAPGGHAWAALLSAAAAWHGHTGAWVHDLHALPPAPGMTTVDPIGGTHYYWPV